VDKSVEKITSSASFAGAVWLQKLDIMLTIKGLSKDRTVSGFPADSPVLGSICVRRFFPFLYLIAFGFFGVSATLAAPNPPAPVLEQNATAAAQQPQIAAAPVMIAPHRAIYTMSLGGVKNGSNISDVTGRMLFEWRDVCDGWAIQQHMQLHFSYADGDDQDVTSTELTWESKDSRHYNFNIRRVTNGKETENYRGKAALNDDGSGTVTYVVPDSKTMQLPPGTIFPSAHTELILEKAAQGDKLFTRRVFDGTDEDGSSDISAFILPSQAMATEAGFNAKLKDNPLLSGPSWPVHMAFFKIGTETGEPDYEMDLNLMSNGVARHMKIDYGDFSVNGVLENAEALPPQGCQ
jgi:hypothetical protein